MSAVPFFTILTVIAGVLIVMIMPLIWDRIGGAVGLIAGALCIPAIWGLVVYVGGRIAAPILGVVNDPENMASPTTTTNIIVLLVFVGLAIFLSRALSNRDPQDG